MLLNYLLQSLKSFLDGLGQDSKGFYKQYIVDRGGNYLEAKRTDLEVARTKRIYKETFEEKEKNILENEKFFFNIGSKLDHAEFAKTMQQELAAQSIYEGIGVTDKEEIAETRKKYHKAAVRGALTKILESPEMAMNASSVLQYFQSMGSKSYYNTLTPAAKDAVKQIRNLYRYNRHFYLPTNFLEIANDNADVFENAINIGGTYQQIEKDKFDRLKKSMENIQKETEESIITGIDKTTTEIRDGLGADVFKILGTEGSITQIQERLQYLNMLPDLLMSSDERNTEKHRKLKDEIEKAKDQIAEGLVVRMMRTADGRQNAEQIANIFKNNDFEQLVDFMPSLQFNLFNQIAQSDNAKAFEDIAKGASANVKLAYNQKEAQIEIQAVNEANYLKRLAASNTSYSCRN